MSVPASAEVRSVRTTSSHAPPSALLRGQLVHTIRELWRSRVAFVFTLLFPLTWLVIIGFLAGNEVVDERSGVRVSCVTPTVAATGVLYATLPTVATIVGLAREHGVLKRVRGTPLPAWVYLAGRIGGAVVLAFGSLLLMLAVGVLAYDVQIVWRAALAAAVTIVVAIACFAAIGLAVAALARSSTVAQSASIAAAVVLGFISELFFVGQAQPAWMTRLASVFPLAHFVRALKEQFNPFASGGGWDGTALLVMAAWAVGAGLVATRAFRWDPVTRGTTRRSRAQPRPAHAGRLIPVGAQRGHPSLGRLLWDQIVWSSKSTWRDLGSVFFATAMPILVYAISVSFFGSQFDFQGKPFGVVMASGMIAWGGAVTGFINLPEKVLLSRERGELKRLRATPLPPALYLTGRTLSVVLWSLASAALLVGIGVAFLHLEVSWSGLLPAAAILILGVLTMAAAGLALGSFLPDSKATTAVGLGILLPLAFFSDVFPVYGAPAWMGTIGSFLPLKPVANGISSALFLAGTPVNWLALGVTLLWLLAAGLVAVRRFRWSGQ